ncbi:MAG TPA: EFR1 family ferrodoxin [Candidatus Lokiarchaeia archaeon]|nr:EFR1 family ferrodoxin [Candidatus Lokiarchaeia archaeon]
MTTTLYYFSGTGNSAYTARIVAQNIEQCDIIPIAKYRNTDSIQCDAEQVGFIFPLYFMGLPDIVYTFVEKLDLSQTKSIFALVTLGGKIHGGALHQLNKLLKKKSNSLAAGFYIRFPGNYIIIYEISSKVEQVKLFESAESKIVKFSDFLKQGENKLESEKIYPILAFINNQFRKGVHERDRNFNVDQNCTSCGTCELICPVSNITLIEGKPKWNHQCQQCLACIHYCPTKAIQYARKTLNKERYHHPKVTVKDISNQKVV